MALDFESGSSEYLLSTSSPITAVPFSVAAWFKPEADAGVAMTAIGVSPSSGNGSARMIIRYDQAGNQLQAYAENTSAVSAGADSAAAVTVGAWSHGCAVFTSNVSRDIYLNGTGASNTTDITLPALARNGVGTSARPTPSSFFDGLICDAAMWNASLTAADALMLANGVSPLMVKPASLVFYMPLIRDIQEIRAGLVMTATGTTVAADHARVRFPMMPFYSRPGAAAGVVGPLLGGRLVKHGILQGRLVGAR